MHTTHAIPVCRGRIPPSLLNDGTELVVTWPILDKSIACALPRVASLQRMGLFIAPHDDVWVCVCVCLWC